MLLEMRDIHKSFNGIQVLDGVKLSVDAGEVHALLGENGAGKSTLMNVLTGVFPKDSGSITFDGNEIDHTTIQKTERAGIAFVHQELFLFNDLKVYENIFLCKEYTNKFGGLEKGRMKREAAQLFERLGVEIDPEESVANLSASQKQLLEISKALFGNAKLLILDEPTTSLNNEEIAHLFSIMNNLKKEGTSFIFISHKMPEIFEIADRYTVFRNGQYVSDGAIRDITPEEVTRMMVGQQYSDADVYESRTVGETVLELEQFTGSGFHDVNLQVKKGQIIGFTGLQGSGCSELMQGIFGVTPVTAGTMKAFGALLSNHSIHHSMKAKVAMLATNRKENSVIADMSLLENMYVAEHTLSAWKFQIHKKEEEQKFAENQKLLSIKAQNCEDSILALSGGNQQKVFLARWLNTDAEVLLLDNPTQGIDVGAKAEIYKLILQLAKDGKTILINTLEIPELKKVADSCMVFYDGTIVKELGHEEITEETVMMYATSADTNEKGEEQHEENK